MSIWGKVIGGVTGFAMGGPLGALLGAMAGHAFFDSRQPERDAGAEVDGQRQVAFTTAVIVLAAKMAKVDGRVTRDEIDAFKRVFHIPPVDMKGIGNLFDKARKDAHGFEPYARQIADMFAHEPAVLEELLGGLFHIAQADGVVNHAELDYLRRVAAIFGFDARRFDRVHAGAAGPGEGDPYKVMGLTRRAADAEIKSTYRRLMREHHPDTLIAQGMPKEFVDVATDKVAAINAAYDRIKAERGLK